MTEGESLGPVEGRVVAVLLLPLGFRVAGVEVGAFADEWCGGEWITARQVARIGHVPLRAVRHHLGRLVDAGRVECDASPHGAPSFRWRGDVAPSLYADVEPVEGPSPIRDCAPTF